MPGAGFSTVEPWLPLNPDWQRRNVAAQEEDPASMLHLYRRLLAVRRSTPALALGALRLHPAPPDVLAYEREYEGQRVFVALNLGSAPRDLMLPPGTAAGEILVATGARRIFDGRIAGDEGLMVALVSAEADAPSHG